MKRVTTGVVNVLVTKNLEVIIHVVEAVYFTGLVSREKVLHVHVFCLTNDKAFLAQESL